MVALPTPEPGTAAAEAFVGARLSHLFDDEPVASPAFRGGQAAADFALASFDVSGYRSKRNEVYPATRRGASRLSPYIRHGLLSLQEVWNRVADGPTGDVSKFRDELLWQEYARHWYARLGTRTRSEVRNRVDPSGGYIVRTASQVFRDDSMACTTAVVDELETTGWLVNQTRMWLSSHWSIREGLYWRDGEDYFFGHLLDGSRAANRLGWQWTSGAGSSKAYGFSRYHVAKRAPGLCDTCSLQSACPIEEWPADPLLTKVDGSARSTSDPDLATTAGPTDVRRTAPADQVWLTAESLGETDPALAANPDLPVLFVFDESLLARLRLSAKRLVFLTETLSELARGRDLELVLGDPSHEIARRKVAVTFAPVPGFGSMTASAPPAELHPWPWLVAPHAKSVASFSAWRKHLNR